MWAQLINTGLGLWLMITPSLLFYNSAGADSAHIVGPILVTFSVTSLWECTRVLRKYNYPFALWLLLAPWILDYNNSFSAMNDMGVGLLILVFSSIQGKIEKRYGGGWSALWKDEAYMKKNQSK